MERDNNKFLQTYQKMMEKNLAKNGDNFVLFADFLERCTSKGKMQVRAIVVTDSNIYRLVIPKKFAVLDKVIPLAGIVDVVLSSGHDQLLVVHTTPKFPDLLLDFKIASEEGKEKLSEFVTVLHQAFDDYVGKPLNIYFSDKTEWKKKGKQKTCILSLAEFSKDIENKREKSGKPLISPRGEKPPGPPTSKPVNKFGTLSRSAGANAQRQKSPNIPAKSQVSAEKKEEN